MTKTKCLLCDEWFIYQSSARAHCGNAHGEYIPYMGSIRKMFEYTEKIVKRKDSQAIKALKNIPLEPKTAWVEGKLWTV